MMEWDGPALEVGATCWCRSLLPNLGPDVNAVIAVPSKIPIPASTESVGSRAWTEFREAEF